MDRTLLLATRNPGKRREYEMMLCTTLPEGWDFCDIGSWPGEIPDVVEDRATFVGNAIKKAVESARATGCAALSEDSGLVVDALGGAPGVHSARFSAPNPTGAKNNALLIERLHGVPDAERTARYVALLCLAIPDDPCGRELLDLLDHSFGGLPAGEPAKEGCVGLVEEFAVVWFRGTVEGRIVDEARGDGGFGYDPHFLVPMWNKRMAEVPAEQKNRISHRARALGKLAATLKSKAL
ncbi:MAG: non-canonical purine NTP pyrophosphatase [Myxococcota bacterium]